MTAVRQAALSKATKSVATSSSQGQPDATNPVRSAPGRSNAASNVSCEGARPAAHNEDPVGRGLSTSIHQKSAEQTFKRRRIPSKQRPPNWLIAETLLLATTIAATAKRQSTSQDDEETEPTTMEAKRQRLHDGAPKVENARLPACSDYSRPTQSEQNATGSKEQNTTGIRVEGSVLDGVQNSHNKVPEAKRCSVDCHFCDVDPINGCASCHRTCHGDCTDTLCKYRPCPYCLSLGVPIVAASALCIEVQKNGGCHSCGQLNCYASCPDCPCDAHDVDAKPRTLYNLGSSCWINAGIQALFSPRIFKTILMERWDRLDPTLRENLVRAAKQQYKSESIHAGPARRVNYETLLAIIYGTAHMRPHTVPLYPRLFTDNFYTGRQNDASELITLVLDPDESPALSAQLRLKCETFLECSNPSCNHRRPSGTESMKCLTLPLQNSLGEHLHTVQEAIDA